MGGSWRQVPLTTCHGRLSVFQQLAYSSTRPSGPRYCSDQHLDRHVFHRSCLSPLTQAWRRVEVGHSGLRFPISELEATLAPAAPGVWVERVTLVYHLAQGPGLLDKYLLSL